MIDGTLYKRCSKCKEEFPLTPEFFRRKQGGFRPECKKCSKQGDRPHKCSIKNAICAYCKEPFYQAPCQPEVIHCSQACREKTQERAKREREPRKTYSDNQRPQETYSCLYCGKEFQARRHSSRPRKFCSRVCHQKYDPYRGTIGERSLVRGELILRQL